MRIPGFMQRLIVLRVLLAVATACSGGVVVSAQDVPTTRPTESNEALIARLSSPFESERNWAAEQLIAAAPPEAELFARFSDGGVRLRCGLAYVLGGVVSAKSVDLLVDAARQSDDRFVREALARAVFRALMRHGHAAGDVLARIPADDGAFQTAARDFVRAEIERFDRLNTEWSFYRRLSGFVRIGHYAESALESLLDDPDVAESVQCLAATALGRVDCRYFWVAPDGGFSEAFRRALKNCGENPRIALIYAAAAYGVTSKKFIEDMAKFAHEDAFDPMLLEAALYFLSTRPDDVIAANFDVLDRCAREFTRGYDERVLFAGATLMRKIVTPASARDRIADMAKTESFGGWALYDAILAGLEKLPQEEGAQEVRDFLAFGLKHSVPQIRGWALVQFRRIEKKDPEGIDVEKIVGDVVRATKKIHGPDLDQDCYAQRTGALTLAMLGAAETAAVLRELFGFPQETVRCAAAMAAAAGTRPLAELCPELYSLSTKDGEWDRFGAAYTLMKSGDRRALPIFADLLACGNRVLAIPSLINLEWMAGKSLGVPAPTTIRDWDILAERWRVELGATPESQPQSQPTRP
jgi:hypothetical protein